MNFFGACNQHPWSMISFTVRYLKSLLGMPKCQAKSAIIYSRLSCITSMCHIYFQCHSLSIVRKQLSTVQALHTHSRKDLSNTKEHHFYQDAVMSGTNSMTTLKTKIKSMINVDQRKVWLDLLKNVSSKAIY